MKAGCCEIQELMNPLFHKSIDKLYFCYLE